MDQPPKPENEPYLSPKLKSLITNCSCAIMALIMNATNQDKSVRFLCILTSSKLNRYFLKEFFDGSKMQNGSEKS